MTKDEAIEEMKATLERIERCMKSPLTSELAWRPFTDAANEIAFWIETTLNKVAQEKENK